MTESSTKQLESKIERQTDTIQQLKNEIELQTAAMNQMVEHSKNRVDVLGYAVKVYSQAKGMTIENVISLWQLDKFEGIDRIRQTAKDINPV